MRYKDEDINKIIQRYGELETRVKQLECKHINTEYHGCMIQNRYVKKCSDCGKDIGYSLNMEDMIKNQIADVEETADKLKAQLKALSVVKP